MLHLVMGSTFEKNTLGGEEPRGPASQETGAPLKGIPSQTAYASLSIPVSTMCTEPGVKQPALGPLGQQPVSKKKQNGGGGRVPAQPNWY